MAEPLPTRAPRADTPGASTAARVGKSPGGVKGAAHGGKGKSNGGDAVGACGKGVPPGAPVGKGKAKATGGKGKVGVASGPRRPKVVPSQPMKPLWWKRFQMGVDLQPGATIWDAVQDDEELVPTTALESRFSKAANAARFEATPERDRKARLLRRRSGSICDHVLEKETQLSVLDLGFRVGREPELKKLPAADVVAQAIEELADEQLTLGELERVRLYACPEEGQLDLIQAAMDAQPSMRLALLEEYMFAVGSVTAHAQRLDCWSFVRSYRDRVSACSAMIEDFLDVLDAFQHSEALPAFLGLVLATGNHLNAGSITGLADGFDIEAFDRLKDIKDDEGKDVRHFILEVFFSERRTEASTLIHELWPCFEHIGRGVTKDAKGIKVPSKVPRVTLEAFQQSAAALQDELSARRDLMRETLELVLDDADAFRVRMPREFEQACAAIEELDRLRSVAEERYSALLSLFHVHEMKSADFFLLWDNLFIPGDMLVSSVDEGHGTDIFLRGEPFNVEDLLVLWGFEKADMDAKRPVLVPRHKERREGSRRSVKRIGLGALGKPSIVPSRELCPLVWKKLTWGADLQRGNTIWDEVADAHHLLPIDALERRFDAGAPTRLQAKQAELAATGGQADLDHAAAALVVDKLPSGHAVARAIAELDAGTLTLAELQDVRRHLCCSLAELTRLSNEKREALTAADEFRLAMADIPFHQERADCWIFVRRCDEEVVACSKMLNDFLDIVDSVQHSGALPILLALVLMTGNYLNGSSSRGQADGFEFQSLALFEGIRDPTGKDLRHFIFDVFFHRTRDKAQELIHELSPCFMNVGRKIVKDEAGAEILRKTVHVTKEECEGRVETLQSQFSQAHALMETALSKLEPDCAFGLQMPKAFERARVAIESLEVLRDMAKQRYDALLGWLRAKPVSTAEFCLLIDDFFVPGTLMCNKGKERYFTAAFCMGEPLSLAQLEVLWGLETSVLAPAATVIEVVSDAAATEVDPAGEGLLDAEDFCKALAPCLHYLDDFDTAARAYSVCLGTRDLGGDLGEVERGQMHPAIEAVLFDPELELGKALGPVKTEAGWHLIWARSKIRGILSMTVRANHILIKPGWHEPPAEEESLALAPQLAGEEGNIFQTWRQWSFALSLPPVQNSDEEMELENLLSDCREALRGRPGLASLFSWRNCYIFSVKGVPADVGRSMAGLVLCATATGTQEIGELLTAEDSALSRPDAEGFEARLRWRSEGWQEASGILDAEGSCSVHLELHKKKAGDAKKATPATTMRLRLRPTQLAYAASEPGLRLALCSATSRYDRRATLRRPLDDGQIVVHVDNTAEDDEKVVDPRPGIVVQAATIRHEPGSRLLVVHEGRLRDATVQAIPDERRLGNRHRLRFADIGENGLGDIEMDLNEMNHSVQRFVNGAAFEAARRAYCEGVAEAGRFIEDAITGNRLSVTEQLVRLSTESRHAASDVDQATIARMAYDDLEWVAGAEIGLRDRVWAQGREGYVEHLHRHGRCIVKLNDGSTTAPLATSSLKKARPIAGVQAPLYASVRDVSGLAPLLLRPNQGRPHGTHCAQPVLVCAGPGTGKSWSMQQLAFLLATSLSDEGSNGGVDPVRMVPLLIPIQKLARMMRDQRSEGSHAAATHDTNLVRFYILREFPEGPTRDMLMQALEIRALVVMLDGVDEAANVKQAIEDFVTKTLVPMGVPLVLTSRPEGIRKRLYARDFVIMHLQPLSTEEQHQIAEKQLKGNPVFGHLTALAGLRKQPGACDAEQMRSHREFFHERLRAPGGGAIASTEIDTALERRLCVFEAISGVPVLLSVLVCALSGQQDQLPEDIFELYRMGVDSTLRRHFGAGTSSESDEVDAQVRATTQMLKAIAAANHLAKRRTFQPADIRRALVGRPDLLALWSRLLERGEVPLIKILTLGDGSGGEFQFRHLSFQEYLFVDVLCGEESSCTSKAHSFGASDEQLSVSMNDPFYRNAMSLGRGHLGRTFAMQRPAWNFDCQPRLAPLGRVALRHLLAGAVALRSLDLSSVGFSTPSDVATLAEAAALAGLPALEELSMRCCQLPASAAGALGSLLAQAPRLARLDLECNRDLLRTPEAVASLTDALGDRRLASLTRLSLRWCQVPAAVSLSLGALLARCCPKLVEVDLLGCRQLRHSDIATSLPPTVKLKGLAAAC